jgi:DNA-binding transcriptional regulator YdaS (Cro superfamily)
MDIQEIVEKAGGAKKVAGALNLTYQAVHQWEQVPAKHVFKVARMAKVEPEKVCPEMFE